MAWVARVAAAVVVLLPAVAVLGLLRAYAVDVPFWDQWELVGTLAALDTGSLGWSDVFRQHNEHRMVFPKLIMLGLAPLTGWNVVAEMLVGVGLATATLMVLAALMRPLAEVAGRVERLAALLVVSLAVFSLAQWENWLWGWQIQWFLGVLAAIAAIALATWSLGRDQPWPFAVAAAAAAAVCQFSLASGLVVWVLAGAVLACHPRRRAVLVLWLALFAVATAIFFVGYQQQAAHPPLATAFRQPGAFLTYLGNYLSGPIGFAPRAGYATTVLFLLLGLAAWLRWRHAPARVLPWLAIGGFALANAALTGIGRVGFGAGQGLAGRYVTIAALLVVAVVPLALLAIPGLRLAKIAGLTGLAALLVLGSLDGLAGAEAHARRLGEGRDCLLRIEAASDECLRKLYPDAAVLRARASELRRLGWGGLGPPA